MHGAPGLAGTQQIPETRMQVDTCSLVVRRSGELGQPGNLAVVDGADDAGTLRQERAALARLGWHPHAALRLADALELGPCTPAVERFGRHGRAVPRGCRAGKLE